MNVKLQICYRFGTAKNLEFSKKLEKYCDDGGFRFRIYICTTEYLFFFSKFLNSEFKYC